MKRKILFIIIIFIISSTAIFYNIHMKNKMLRSLSGEAPVILSASLGNGESGTFTYNIGENNVEKISDHVFTYCSYNDDRSKIIGFIWDDEFQGIAEFDVEHHKFSPVIEYDDIRKCMKDVGEEVKEYNDKSYLYPDFRYPKYNISGYTFNYMDEIYLMTKQEENWGIETISKDGHTVDNYFLDNNKLFIESHIKEKDTVTRMVYEKNIKESNRDMLLKQQSGVSYAHPGLMDMPDAMDKIVYFGNNHIYLYDVEKKTKKNIVRHILYFRNMLNIRLSKDNRFIFYTTGEAERMFGGDDLYSFYVVDVKTRARIRLKRWTNDDSFYGFDW